MENFHGKEKLVSLNPFKRHLPRAYTKFCTATGLKTTDTAYLVLMAEKRKEKPSQVIV